MKGSSLQPGEQIGHLERHFHGLAAFVTGGERSALLRLCKCFHREDAERNRDTRITTHLAQTSSTLARDVLEMWRVAADHATQCHDGVVVATSGQLPRHYRQFKSARNA